MSFVFCPVILSPGAQPSELPIPLSRISNRPTSGVGGVRAQSSEDFRSKGGMGQRPLTRPAPAVENAGCGPHSPLGRGQRPILLPVLACLLLMEGIMSSFKYLSTVSKPWESPVMGCFRRWARTRLANAVLVGACVLAAGISTPEHLSDNGRLLRESCRVPHD